MGIFLIFAILLVIGIALIITGIIIDIKSKYYDGFTAKIIGTFMTMLFGFAVILCLGFILDATIERDIDYQKYELQYQIISKKLDENEENYYLLVSDIKEYNNAVLEDRYWSNNLWVNWYHNGKIKDLPLIGEPSEKPTSVSTPRQFSNFEPPSDCPYSFPLQFSPSVRTLGAK